MIGSNQNPIKHFFRTQDLKVYSHPIESNWIQLLPNGLNWIQSFFPGRVMSAQKENVTTVFDSFQNGLFLIFHYNYILYHESRSSNWKIVGT